MAKIIIPQEMIFGIKVGDPEFIGPLIMLHEELSGIIAGEYIKKRGAMKDDIISASYHGLVQGVRWIFEGRVDHDNWTGYLVVTMRRFIREQIHSDQTVRVPESTWRATEDKSTLEFKTYSIHGYYRNLRRDASMYDGTMTSEDRSLAKHCERPKDQDNVMLESAMEDMKLSEKETEVLLLRMDGYTVREIVAKLELSIGTVHGVIAGIKRKASVYYGKA